MEKIIANKGSMTGVVVDVEHAVRRVDPTGTVKPTALLNGLKAFDARNSCKFSKAAKKSPDDWAQKAKEEVRGQLKAVNMQRTSQKLRDEDKKKRDGPLVQEETDQKTGVALKRPSAFDEPGAAGADPKKAKAAPAPPVGLGGASGATKTVQVPDGVNEAVLAAAIQAAMRATTAQVGAVTVSVPAGGANPAVAKKPVEEAEGRRHPCTP